MISRVGEQQASNPFEAFGLDPFDGASAITEALRERIEAAEDEEERERIRAWQKGVLIDKHQGF